MTMKFKVLGGTHTERGKQIGVNPDNQQPIYCEVDYERNEVVETDIDLAKKFNPKGAAHMAKFQRLADSAKPTFKENSRFTKTKPGEDSQSMKPEKSRVSGKQDAPPDPDDDENNLPTGDEDGGEETEEEYQEVVEEEDEGELGNDTLDTMTQHELETFAKGEGISLAGCKNKAEMKARIRGGSGQVL